MVAARGWAEGEWGVSVNMDRAAVLQDEKSHGDGWW